MADVNSFFGFELFQKLHHDDIRRKEDVIILFVHWCLTKSGFRCIGVGDEVVFDASEKGSELLPTEWNLCPCNYALRYVRNGKLHVLLGVKSDTDLLLNLMRHHDSSVFNLLFPIEATVTGLHGPLEQIMPSYRTMLQSIQKEFVNLTCFNDVAIQTSDEHPPETNPICRVIHHPITIERPHPPFQPRNDRVGVGDLDPFGRGGGMIFDPFDMQRRQIGRAPSGLGVPGVLPPGAIPPGARFDPLGPPDINPPYLHRPRPDGAHPPPGYDDMFQ